MVVEGEGAQKKLVDGGASLLKLSIVAGSAALPSSA